MRHLNLMLAAIWRLAPNLNTEIGCWLGATQLQILHRSSYRVEFEHIQVGEVCYLLQIVKVFYFLLDQLSKM